MKGVGEGVERVLKGGREGVERVLVRMLARVVERVGVVRVVERMIV